MAGELEAALAGGGNALLVGPASDEAACAAASTVVEPADALVLVVAFDVEPEARVTAWRRHVGVAPARAACVAAGEGWRGGEAGDVLTPGPECAVVVDAVPDPTDLAGVGEAVTRQLADWDHLEGRLVVCLDSLTALLAHVEVGPAFRFLQLLTRQVAHAGGVGHYHVDPAAVDPVALGTLRPLFDVEATVEGAGSWTVRATR